MLQCVCLNGYLPSSGDQNSCVDIDECADGSHTCHANANCINQPGGYLCQCAAGLTCGELALPISQHYNASPSDVVVPDHNTQSAETNEAEEPTAAQPSATDVPQPCSHCASNADCYGDTCVCRPGYQGDGVTCNSVCDEYSVWSYDQCVPVDVHSPSTEELDEEGRSSLFVFGDANQHTQKFTWM